MKKYLLIICLILIISTNSLAQTKCDKLCWTARFTLISGIIADGVNSNSKINSGNSRELNPFLRSGNKFSVGRYVLINSLEFATIEYLGRKNKKFYWLMFAAGIAKFVVIVASR
jgi:hypothetical protein